MGLWLREMPYSEGERPSSTWGANFYSGARMVGGRIAITNQAIVFEPNWLDYSLRARGWRVPLHKARGVAIEPKQLSMSPHKVRTRVKINVAGLDPLLVAVRHPDRFVEDASRAIAGSA
jgi:hypothetical protein